MGRVQRRFSSSTGKIRGFLVGPNRGRQKLSSICYVMGWRTVLPTGSSVLNFAFSCNAEDTAGPSRLRLSFPTSPGLPSDRSQREILKAGSRAGTERSSEERKRRASVEPTRSILDGSTPATQSPAGFTRF